jgi:hypothetical protein
VLPFAAFARATSKEPLIPRGVPSGGGHCRRTEKTPSKNTDDDDDDDDLSPLVAPLDYERGESAGSPANAPAEALRPRALPRARAPFQHEIVTRDRYLRTMSILEVYQRAQSREGEGEGEEERERRREHVAS